LVVLGLSLLSFEVAPQSSAVVSRVLFGNLQAAVFAVIWLVVPFLTADVLSRERREGTLGLLFLTPLTARAVVMGKGMAQALRALMLVLATGPFLAVPLLLGGVSVWEVGLAAMADAASLVLALAAGLAASAWTRGWNRAFLATMVMVVVGLAAVGVLYGHSILMLLRGVSGIQSEEIPWWIWAPGGVAALSGAGGFWGVLVSQAGCRVADLLWLHAGVLAGSVVVAAALVELAGWRLRRGLREEPLSRAAVAWSEMWLRPLVWRRWHARRMRRLLDRNPVGWLQRRRATARLTKWGWCVVVAVWVSASLYVDGGWEVLPWGQFWLAMFLAGGVVVSAAGSFHVERETGALELLLVTPLGERQLVLGRLREVWAQFLPAGVLLALPLVLWEPAWQWDWRWSRDDQVLGRWLPLVFAGVVVTVPCVGLYYSLTRRTWVGAFLVTVVVGLVVPWLAGAVALFYAEMLLRGEGQPWFWVWPVTAMLTGMVVGGRCLWRLHWRLVNRAFPWVRGSGS